jgi:glucan phosphoethanolaminetransferase (alkaline phosphatase superfamily)
MYKEDPHFHIEPVGYIILASLCLVHTTVLSLPGKIGNIIGLLSLVIAAFFTLMNTVHIRLFKGPLAFISLASTVHSNAEETTEFFESYGPQIWTDTTVFLVCIAACLWAYLATRPAKGWVLASIPLLLTSVLMVPLASRFWQSPKQSLWVVHEYAYIDRFLTCILRYKQIFDGKANAQTYLEKRHAIRQNLRVMNRSHNQTPNRLATDEPFSTKTQGNIKRSQESQSNSRPQSSSKDTKLPVPLVVIVIGESTSRGHMGVYGYKHQTTPRMHALREHLVFFSDAISPVANTIPAVLGALCADSFDPKTWHCESPNLMEVAHSAGYKTTWISNQSPTGFGENMISVLGQSADKGVFVNRQVATGGETAEHVSLDEKVLPAVRERLSEFHQTGQPQMLFIHLMGTHFSYEKRYPHNASHPFRAITWPSDPSTGSNARTIIHHYDNAICYQDMVLGEIFSALEKSPANGLFFYFSDHGEEVFDSEDFFGHSEGRLTPAMREIPFVVGFSRGLEQNFPDLVKTIQEAHQKPFTLAKLTLSVLDILGLEYPGMPRRESVFSPDFVPTPRMTYSGPYERSLR